MKKNILLITIIILATFSIGFGQRPDLASQNIIKNKKIVIKNKASNNVLGLKASNTPAGTQVWQTAYTGSALQKFTISDAGDGGYYITTANGLFLSLKISLLTDGGGSTSSSGTSNLLIQDRKYADGIGCNVSTTSNCPKHQIWKIKPFARASQTFVIENVGTNGVLQPVSNNSNVNVPATAQTNELSQQWVIVEPDDLALSATATQEEISEFDDILANQYGVAVLDGETTKPFYFNHDKPNERIYKYKKIVHAPGSSSIGTSLDAWYPVEKYRKTVCGNLREYKQVPQDLWHDGTVNLDVDANLHIVPNSKFNYMLKNPRMESYANEQYFKQRYNFYCSQLPSPLNCSNPPLKANATEKARKDVLKFLEEHAFDNIEGEITPAMQGNPQDVPNKKYMIPANNLFSFNPVNMGSDICAYGPWMWERILYDDWAIIGLFRESHFNNEIHPANQIWFTKNNTLNLIAVVDQTGYFEVPRNPSNNTEVHASGLNQRMRFHVAFQIPSSDLNRSEKVIEYQINAKGFEFNNQPENPVQEITIPLKYKDILKLKIRDNSFLKLGKTHRVFVDRVKMRPDGSLQGFLVVETEPIIRRGGSINVFVNRQ